MRGMKVMVSAFAVFSLAPAAFESASAASDPTGIWMNDTGRGAIEIKHCGDTLCGNVVWVKNAADAEGLRQADHRQRRARSAAAVGTTAGSIRPRRAANTDVELTPLDNGTLRVTATRA